MNSADIAAKYQKTYFMPPEVTYDWVKKDSITNSLHDALPISSPLSGAALT